MFIEVVRSTRRRKSVELRASQSGKSLTLTAPQLMSAAEEREHLATLIGRFQRKRKTPRVDLAERADFLSNEYGLPRVRRIEWVDNQTTRWGSCTTAKSHIRLSTMLSGFPQWVIDYVIIHELTHLMHPGHPPAFWAVVNRYPLAERARGFLIAKGSNEPIS